MVVTAWIVLLTVLATGWVVLDGAVQGACATLLRARSSEGGDRQRDPAERQAVLLAVRPLRLPGEAWLVAALAVLVGVFPRAGEDLMGIGYPVAGTFLVSWLVRDLGIWLRAARDGQVWRNLWDAVLVVASIMFAGSWGALLGMAWGSGLAAVALGVVAVVVTRLHGDAVVSWRQRRTGPVSVIVTSAMSGSLVVGTAVAASRRLADGVVSADTTVAFWCAVLVVLPALVWWQVSVWRRISRPVIHGGAG